MSEDFPFLSVYVDDQVQARFWLFNIFIAIITRAFIEYLYSIQRLLYDLLSMNPILNIFQL